MPRSKLVAALKSELRRAGEAGFSMQLRLFLFLLFFLAAIMLGLFVILLASGAFSAGVKENRRVLENELSHLSQDVYQDFGDISVQAVSLSQAFSTGIELTLSEHGVSPAQLKNHPELLDEILENELARVLSAIERSKGSGIFLILDATINPGLESAGHSKAGLYIRNMEPNIINASFPDVHMMRGPAFLARQYNMKMLPQWALEFDISDARYYSLPMRMAAERDLPLSRLYYWAPGVLFPKNGEDVYLCSVPLVAHDGTVMGVCGIEVSAMLFKLAYMPDNANYTRIFSMAAPVEGQMMNTSQALFAGLFSAAPDTEKTSAFFIREGSNGFHSYAATPGGGMYAGLHTKLKLYPEDSAFSDQEWIFALLMPRQDLDAIIKGKSTQLLYLLLLLMALSIGASALISAKYIKPVKSALSLIKSSPMSGMPKTRIPEIDDLIDFLSAQDEAASAAASPAPQQASSTVSLQSSAMFSAFMENVKSLTVSERTIFDLYMQGYTAREIAEKLFLSINTIKTHNKHIYVKLNVTSRKELLVYMKMMEESNALPDGSSPAGRE